MARKWDTEEVFLDGDAYFERLMADIRSAKESLTLEVYIFNDDVFGNLFADALIEARARGLRVQIIVDGVGSHNFYLRLHRRLVEAGVQIKVYNPLPFYHPFLGKMGLKKKLSALGFRLWRINRRNHRKIFIIDERIIYLGSFNVTAEHTHLHTEEKWKDIGARVTGEDVQYAVLQFKKLWKLRDYLRGLKSFRKRLPGFRWKDSSLRLNQSVISKGYYQRDLLKRIRNAKERIWLTTPYFIPTRKLIRELAKASRRGVDVKLLIASRTDVSLFRTLRAFYYSYLLKRRVRIFEYSQSVLHAKVFILDDWITLGSSNLNHRSFLHDLEADLSIQEKSNKQLITEDFIKSTATEVEITADYLKQRPWFDKLIARLLFLFKYWF
jgi:cardiolipin synthase